MASGNQFSDDSPFADKYGPPPVGRKRPMDQQFGGDVGGESDGDLGPDFQKRSRFDSPQVESELDRLDVPPATLRILVRQIDAGGIIGKGGENIKRLRKVHDCQVVLPDSPGAPERVMTVMGRIEGCIGVLRDCLPKLGDGQHGDPNQLAYETQVLVPQPFMGTIIGTAGSKIKELRSKTKTSIKIFSDPMPNSNERSVQLIGTEQQIAECLFYFLDEIGKKEPREPIYLYEPTAEFSSTQQDDFPPPRRGGHNFRGGMDGGRGGRGGGGWRGGRGGGGGGDRGGRGRGFQGSWRGRNNGGPGGNSHQPPYQPPPNPAPPMGGGTGYGAPPHISSRATSYGGSASVGYSTMPQAPPPSSMPPPASSAVPQMYMPPSASLPPPPSQMMPPPPSQHTQQVTIPNEYAMSILGVNGANMEHIKSQSSCDIVITDPKPGSMERIINISGSPSNIQLAQTLMQNSVRQYHPV